MHLQIVFICFAVPLPRSNSNLVFLLLHLTEAALCFSQLLLVTLQGGFESRALLVHTQHVLLVLILRQTSGARNPKLCLHLLQYLQYYFLN